MVKRYQAFAHSTSFSSENFKNKSLNYPAQCSRHRTGIVAHPRRVLAGILKPQPLQLPRVPIACPDRGNRRRCLMMVVAMMLAPMIIPALRDPMTDLGRLRIAGPD